jgi:hypothetical protein
MVISDPEVKKGKPYPAIFLCVKIPRKAKTRKGTNSMNSCFHMVALDFRCWLLSLGDQVQSQSSPSEIFDGQSGSGERFAPASHFTNIPHPSVTALEK